MIVVFTAGALFLQSAYILDTQEIMDKIEDRASIYNKFDSEILMDLHKTALLGEEMVFLNLATLWNKTVLQVDTEESPFELFDLQVDSTVIKMFQREKENYDLFWQEKISREDIFGRQIIDEKATEDLETINSGTAKLELKDMQDAIVILLDNSTEDDLLGILDLIDSKIDIINEEIEDDNEEFNLKFDQIKDDINDQFNREMQLISGILIVVMLIIILFVILQIVASLSSINKKYNELKKGNLAVLGKSKKYSSNEFGQMSQGFDDTVNNLRNILQTQQNISERLAGIAEELAAGSEEASASVIEVADTVREFSAGSAEQNLLLNRVQIKLDDHLTDVEKAARQIGETSNFVLKVAKRTNILGLNASIEAAKAGKFGLGFNVVAEEVRTLSEDTKASATQIADLIQEIEYNIKNTVEEIRKEVNITKEVAENTAAGSEEANAATAEQVIMLKEISQTSNELSLLAQELREIIHRFTLE